MEKEMEVLYIEDLASHGGPESCVGDPRGRSEALTGVHVGRAIEPRNPHFGVPKPLTGLKATSLTAFSRAVSGPRAVGEPGHAWSLHAREPGDPMIARPVDDRAGRPGNAQAVLLECTMMGSRTCP